MSVAGRDPSHHELREATLSGVRSVVGARLGVEVLVFGSSLVLARLISPAEFGHAVIALIVTALAASVVPAVLGSRLVQRDRVDREHVEAATWLAIVSGVALSCLTFAVGPEVARPIFGDETADLVRLASPAFLLAGLSVTPKALLQRRLDFGRLSRIEIVASFAGATTAVAAALAGLNAEALVLGSLPAAAINAAMAISAGGFTFPRLRVTAISDIVRFGVPAGLGSVGYTSFRNVDYVIVGAQLGAAQLGAYWRGFQLGIDYQRKISVVMTRIAFPVYSRTPSMERMRALRTRIVRVHATVIFPLLALLIATAPLLVPLLYGPAWESAVLPAQILAVGGMSVAAQTGIGPLILAIGKAKWLAGYVWIALIAYGGAVLVAAPYGLTAVCIAATVSGLCLFLAGRYVLETRIVGIPMRAMGGELGPAAAGSAVLLATAWPAVALLDGAGIPDPVTILIAASVGAGAYALTIRGLFPRAWSDVFLLGRRVLSGGRQTRSDPAPAPAPAPDPVQPARTPA